MSDWEAGQVRVLPVDAFGQHYRRYRLPNADRLTSNCRGTIPPLEGLRMEWARFHRLVDDIVARLKAADGDREGIEAAIRRYIERGHQLGASPYDLWDFFAISSPGIPRRAGYCGAECEQMVAVFDQLSRERFGG